MKYYLKTIGIFLLCLIIWNLGIFLASIIEKTDLPTIGTSIIASLIILPLTYLTIYGTKNSLVEKPTSPIIFAISNTLFTLLVTLLITIPNKTTTIFFGNWFVYITFLSTALGSYLGMKTFSKREIKN